MCLHFLRVSDRIKIMKAKFKELEKIVRGFSNHRRIEILELLEKEPDLSLTEIAAIVRINFKTAGEHVRRLSNAGLVWKRNDFKSVRHTLSPRGKVVLRFLRTLE